ncbi:hypothetical protein SAMN04488118_104300 [Epibacterium ulvae]|uniref:Type III flagellar switch regulator (C-ring) FliN C-term n=2 Tax=Alphaproteobacteria TaxID=28211 RepID=A0A1G5QL01_9RHOB|nr:hypothetical protein [Epibacterium ulvae]AGI04134.1 hypothetical protein [alpha proteobacterium U95]SCZ61839.1 hypothetical protein SAMN04488118_104300 [Epibacterium ulvae]
MIDVSTLKSIDQANSTLFNNLLRFSGEIPFSISPDTSAEPAYFIPRAGLALPEMAITFRLDCDIGSFEISLDQTCLEILCDAILPGWREEPNIAATGKWSCLALAHRVAQEDWAVAQNVRFEFSPIALQEHKEDSLSFYLHHSGATGSGEMSILMCQVDVFERYSIPTELPSQELCWSLPVNAKIELASLNFQSDTLTSLEAGDIVFLPNAHPDTIASQLLAYGESVAGVLNQDGQFHPLTDEPMIDD